jgi:hypothetical protein
MLHRDRCQRLLYSDEVFPAIPEVVPVVKSPTPVQGTQQPRPRLGNDLVWQHVVVEVGVPVVLPVDDEFVHMTVSPAHCSLNHPVQPPQGDLRGHQDAPPDQWLDVVELNAQLQNRCRHW